jgi:small subunit ribosomal protein S1
MEGVEGLVHISELASHHVESPREVVHPGDDVKVKILEIDDDRRRLSLSVKRVEGQVLPRREASADSGDELAHTSGGDETAYTSADEGFSQAPAPLEDEVEETASPDESADAAESADAPAAEGDDAPAAEADEAPAAEAEAPVAEADEAPAAEGDDAPAAADEDGQSDA